MRLPRLITGYLTLFHKNRIVVLIDWGAYFTIEGKLK